MPFKSERIKIEGSDLDRRRKLTPEQRQHIRDDRAAGMSQREVAKKYGISRRLVTFIEDEKKLIENKKRREERGGWKQYYDSDEHAQAVKATRRYKQKLKVEGKIKEK